MTRQCELCEEPARMYCESDQASLCWDCDAKVHGANFLVARHTRCLLCRSCQTPTPWRASGSRLGPTFSVCQRCLSAGVEGDACNSGKGEAEGGGARVKMDTASSDDLGDDDGENDEDEVDEDVEEEEEDDDDEEDDKDADNQVVPWSMEAAGATPPPVASYSSSEESPSERRTINEGSLKRTRGSVTPSTSLVDRRP